MSSRAKIRSSKILNGLAIKLLLLLVTNCIIFDESAETTGCRDRRCGCHFTLSFDVTSNISAGATGPQWVTFLVRQNADSFGRGAPAFGLLLFVTRFFRLTVFPLPPRGSVV